MQLVAILGVLVAVNVGIVYVGSESVEDQQPQMEGVVEVEQVDAQSLSAPQQSAPVQESTESQPQ
ncbi:MAG: hypothetical protein SV765_05245 [Pseudomonadota bacterium]|nr:hypothetical protein [Pseudomonadales bacterium]MDY6919602.1 hypothetical protein [Pseudomonadota bacterium]